VEGPAGRIQRISGAPPVAPCLLLHSAAAQFKTVPGQADDVERVHHHRDVGPFRSMSMGTRLRWATLSARQLLVSRT